MYLAPIVLAFLALALLLGALGYDAMVRRLEAPYTPDLDTPEAWHASLDVALGVAWFDEPAPTVLPWEQHDPWGALDAALDVAEESIDVRYNPRTVPFAVRHRYLGWYDAAA